MQCRPESLNTFPQAGMPFAYNRETLISWSALFLNNLAAVGFRT